MSGPAPGTRLRCGWRTTGRAGCRRRAARRSTKPEQQAAPVVAELDRLAGHAKAAGPLPDCRVPLLLAHAEQSRLRDNSDPVRWQAQSTPGSGWSARSRRPQRATGRLRRCWALAHPPAGRGGPPPSPPDDGEAGQDVAARDRTARPARSPPLEEPGTPLCRPRCHLLRLPRLASHSARSSAALVARVAQPTDRPGALHHPKTASVHVSRIHRQAGGRRSRRGAAIAHRLGLHKTMRLPRKGLDSSHPGHCH